MNYFRHFLAALILLCVSTSPSFANNTVWSISINGAIGPATADYMVRGLERAEQAGASLVILEIDTPGGLDTAMRQMIKAILASKIPVIAFVSPSGARAASAGTYILYASHFAAMAPATNLGAATPVQIGAPSLPSMPHEKGKENREGEQPGQDSASAMKRKIINDAAAYIQGLAELRGRNAEWAEKAVREGASLAVEEAMELQVIDVIASDIDALLEQLDGRRVIIAGKELTLGTKNAEVYAHAQDWRSELLSVITNPNTAYILMLVGIYGLFIEFSSPGFGVPGVLGAVCLLVALYAFQVLPISYAGLGLIILGISLMTAEAFAPSFGILGLGGIISFAVGSVMLMDTDLPGYQIALPIIMAFTTFSAFLLTFALGLLLKARKQTIVTGLPSLIGASAVVESTPDDIPRIRLQGELWQVICAQKLQPNDRVRVTAADSILLSVELETNKRKGALK